MSQVTYSIELIPENATKIDAINRIMLGDAYTAEAPVVKSAPKSETKDPEPKTKAEPKQEPQKTASTDSVTFDAFKEAAKVAKGEHGEDFVKAAMEQAGCTLDTTLLKSVKAVEAEKRQEVIDLWVAGPVTEAAADEPEDDLDDDFEDDDLGDEEGEAEIDPEAVKTALKAFSKENGREAAKEVMTKNGAAALSKVNDCSQKQLAAMMKELI